MPQVFYSSFVVRQSTFVIARGKRLTYQMDIKTYRAKSMRDALDLVGRELGPSAAVLHTREVNSGPLSRLVFGRKYEVAASAMVNVPSRLPEAMIVDAPVVY